MLWKVESTSCVTKMDNDVFLAYYCPAHKDVFGEKG